jgi:ribosomal protein S18 acetylase RimI-like enzyme
LRIARATIADLEALLPLVTAYRVFYKQIPDAREREFVERNLRENRSTIFLARDGDTGVALGFTQLFQTYSTVWLGPALILEDLFVNPDVRRGGVATSLLEAAVAYAREIGAVGMFLETAMDNATAQAVYERAGWTREGRFYKYNAPL